ncbi:hypothetical protein B0H67DRAFT_675860 [Lasiosphaeris hirsuta]|uniref:Uncharacterized protein n=1 Tax=Lasiosphaeris hirsuta TaxID=260670 RepID=A0AA40DIL1_9PEZI|nr:hypothetical protein B0H67DRAFT_675860 [Lasiosphaeris hirsuta]
MPIDYGQPNIRQPQGLAGAYNRASVIYTVPHATTTEWALQTQRRSPSVSQNHQQPSQQDYLAGSLTAIGGMAANSSAQEDEIFTLNELEAEYESYQLALGRIFQYIQDGDLAPASESLLDVSDWLLSHVVELGLTSDDQNLYNDRIKLCNDFNHAWLAILQAQKDMKERSQLQPSQSLISEDKLKEMGGKLVRGCDGIECHGLVDYEYGVWEEQIIAYLEECLDS